MKKKIVIDLPLSTDRCRSMAMKIAVRSAGVISVSIDEEKGHLVVIGIGVDFFRLMFCIRRKFKCSRIVSIEEVKSEDKPNPQPNPDPAPAPAPDPEPKENCPCPCPRPPYVPYYPVCAQPVYDYDPCNNPFTACAIM